MSVVPVVDVPALDEPPLQMTAAEVCRRCREENLRYRGGEPFADRACFEMARRAVVRRDDACWRGLHEVYHDQVLGWCRKAGAGVDADLEELVGLTWQKFWRSYTPDKLRPENGIAGVLAYLKLCARSAVADMARAKAARMPYGHALAEPTAAALPLDEVQAERAARADFWGVVNRALKGEAERALVHLAYEMGLKSAEIQARRPDLFPDVAAVYRTTRNVRDRLRRCCELREWLEREES